MEDKKKITIADIEPFLEGAQRASEILGFNGTVPAAIEFTNELLPQHPRATTYYQRPSYSWPRGVIVFSVSGKRMLYPDDDEYWLSTLRSGAHEATHAIQYVRNPFLDVLKEFVEVGCGVVAKLRGIDYDEISPKEQEARRIASKVVVDHLLTPTMSLKDLLARR